MKIYHFRLIPLLIIFNSFFVQAQKGRKLDIVTISMDDLALNKQEIPFDVPFYIQVNGLDGYNSIKYSYGAIGQIYKKKWVSLPPLNDNDSIFTSEEVSVIDNHAFLYCPGVHPNLPYEFKLYTKREISKEASFQRGLQDRIIKIIETFCKKYALSKLDSYTRQTMYNDIKHGVRDYIGIKSDESLYGPDGEEFDLIYKYYQSFYNNMAIAQAMILSSRNNIWKQGKGAEAIKTTLEKQKDKIVAQLSDIMSTESIWDETLKRRLNSPLDKSIIPFKDYTLKAGLDILEQLSRNPEKLEKLLKGEAKIENMSVIPASEFDLPSIDFIFSLFKTLNDGNIELIKNNKRKKLFVDDDFRKLNGDLDNLKDSYDQIKNAGAELSKEIEKTQKQITELVVYRTISQKTTVLPILETDKSNYFSIEAGIGGATGLSSAFTYLVANIYFVPINNSASLSTFKGKYWFLKRFSLQFGMANLLTPRPENTSSILGNSFNRDLMLGAGLRLTNLIRINTGTILYRSNRSTPLIDKYKIKPSIYFSLGIDINLLKALGDAVKAFNL